MPSIFASPPPGSAPPDPDHPASRVTLDRLRPGRYARVAAVRGPAVRRLAELGLRPGAWVGVLTGNAGGGVTLAIGTSRLAVDRAVLRGVEIAPA